MLACGGVIVPGTYTVASSCLHSEQPFDNAGSCRGMPVLACSFSDIAATFKFSGDGRYVAALAVTIHETTTIPDSCMTRDASKMSCAEFGPVFNQSLADDLLFPGRASCSGTTTCTCEISAQLGSRQPVSGTYSTEGTNLKLQANGSGGASQIPYCVGASGSQITLGMSSMFYRDDGSGFLVLTRE
jgi:hypothetical protein